MKDRENLIEKRLDTVESRIKSFWEESDFTSTLFESLTGYAIIAGDFDGNILAYNKGAGDIFGYAPEDVIGKQRADIFFDPESISEGRFQQIIDELISKGRVCYQEEMLRKTGDKFPAQILFTLTKSRDGRIIGFILTDGRLHYLGPI